MGSGRVSSSPARSIRMAKRLPFRSGGKVCRFRPRRVWRCGCCPSTSGRRPPLLETPFNEHSPMFSPDGRWVAYVSDETGREEVYLRAHPGEGGKYPISTEGGAEPVWAPSGDELFYRNGDQMIAVTVVTEPDLVLGTPQVLFEGNFAVTYRPDTPRNYDVSRDGQRFLMVQSVGESTRSEINVVLNWVEEPKRLVPTGN